MEDEDGNISDDDRSMHLSSKIICALEKINAELSCSMSTVNKSCDSSMVVMVVLIMKMYV